MGVFAFFKLYKWYYIAQSITYARVSLLGSTSGGGRFGQYVQKLHENYKINIFGAKQWGDMGGQNNFLDSGGFSPNLPPLLETLYARDNITCNKVKEGWL